MNPVPTTAAPISVIGFTTCLILAETVTPIRLLQIGLVGWGRDWACRIVPDVKEVELVGYVNSDPSSLALLREEMPKAQEMFFESLIEAITSTHLEAVLVTTRLLWDAPVTRAAVQAG